jgi:hypothetical protein
METLLKISIFLLAINLFCQTLFAQKVSDVLENGIQVKSGEKIFFQFDGKLLKYALAKSLQDSSNPADFITLGDSTIFLASKSGINVYLKPINPLNYSSSTENKIVIDPINEAAATAMQSIIDFLGTVVATKTIPAPITKPSDSGVTQELITVECEMFNTLQKKVESIQTKLIDDKKIRINEIFKGLKGLDFVDETNTRDSLIKTKMSIVEIENHFKESDKLMIEFSKDIENYTCNYPDSFTTKYIFNAILKEFAITIEEQKRRLKNLQTSFNLVEKAQQTASIGGGEDGLRWCIKLDEIPSSEGKISNYTIIIKESGYEISEKGEIVNIESKDLLKRTVKIRKFQKFVPEVSVGIVYTFFNYNTYGTTSDSTGQQYVASPTNNKVENINISTMINWNLFSPNNSIHPLIQTGVGINSGIPSFLVGGGLRFSNNAKTRLRITGGLAMTWTKELDKLKVGDKVLGTADIDNDLKYSGSPKFSPYIGIQYNFK